MYNIFCEINRESLVTNMQRLKRVWKASWLPVLSVLLTNLYPCVFLFSHNAEEAPFSSMFPFFGIFLLNAAAFLLLFSLVIRRFSAAAVMSNLAMLLVINFSLLLELFQKPFPSLEPLQLMIAFGVLLLGLLIPLAIKRPNMKVGCMLFSLTFGALILVSLFSAGVRQLTFDPSGNETVEQKKYEPKTFVSEERPNVYFFLFDEYGGYENLQHYYRYDNDPFLTELESRGYTVSRDSHNTESILTVTLVPNLMNMNYVCKDKTKTAKKNDMLVMPNFFRTFAENGYEINLVNHLDYFGADGCHVLTEHQSRRTISDYLLKNSVYKHIDALKKLLNDYIQADYVETYRGVLLSAMEAGRNCWKAVGDKPTLTMCYLQTPHAPTILDKNGELVDNYENVGWHWGNFDLYLGQLEFVNRYILDTLGQIQRQDPGALIILQSDHGVRQAKHYYEMGTWKTYDAPMENLYMQNCLNCVYYRGQQFDIGGKTGINTLRTILNQVFGTDYKMIKPKYYTEGEFEKK